MSFILFPTQLFEYKYIPNEFRDNRFYLIDDDYFYGKKTNMKFNKKKIVLHKASCLAYVEEMKNKININYVDEFPKIKEDEDVNLFEVTDQYIEKKLRKTYKSINMIKTPNFMTSLDFLQVYYMKHKKKTRFSHADFYKFQLNLHSIPYITESYDEDNRNPIPNKDIPNTKFKNNKNEYIDEAIKFTEKYYPNNYGTTDDFYLPVTSKEAKNWFNKYLETKMNNFAKYQDAIVPEDPFLYHSIISSSLNIGLLNPDYVIDKVIETYNEKKISKNDYEAFIRQVIGWREYQRFIYIFLYDNIKTSNYFNNKNKLTKKWYDGTTGIPPVDDAINKAFDTGYLHHILRLMVMANFMNICMIDPDEVYKWFMEFAVDSYDWVMVGNVYSMGLWADGGLTMRKPYISSHSYVDNMSGDRYDDFYGDDDEWKIVWRALFYNFLLANNKKIVKTIYSRNLAYAEKLNTTEKSKITNTAKNFIEETTN